MNVSPVITREYKNKSNWKLGENKPNTNPIKPNFRKAKMNVTSILTKDYENETTLRLEQNKPKQTQFLYHWLRSLFIIAAKCCEFDKEF
jgi:hypothetical protein